MRIIIVSDTHGSPNLLLAAVRQAGHTDMLLHLGDGQRDCAVLDGHYEGEVIAVRGNCDFAGAADADERLLTSGGVVIYMAHGHFHDAKRTLNKLWYKGRECGADVVCFGHTHVPLLERNGSLTLMNPGSLRHVQTYGLIEISEGKAAFKLQKL